MKLKQELSLKLLPLPLLIQKLDLLTLPLLELWQTIEQELEQNPFLELEQEEEMTTEIKEEEILLPEVLPPGEPADSESYQPSSDYRENEDEEEKELPLPAPPPTFNETLISQLHLLFNDPKLIRIGEYIIYELDENGFLPLSLKEIADALQENEETVRNILSQIQRFSPPGLGAHNLQECLLIQLHLHPGVPKYVIQIVSKHFNELMGQEYLKIRHSLGISETDFQTALECIKSCNPKPINGLSGTVRHILPDVVIEKRMSTEPTSGGSGGNDWVVSPTTEWIPKLRLSKEYQTLLRSAPKGDAEANEYLKKKLMAAKLLLEGIEKRRTTLKSITQYIAKNILDFLEHKTTSFQFITLEEVGNAIGRDVSTISRAIKGKWVETPYGLVKFKHFFSKGRIKEYLGVKKRMKELVDNENKTHPLKDGEILKILRDEGANLARTTVVKYRMELGIPPAYQRKSV